MGPVRHRPRGRRQVLVPHVSDDADDLRHRRIVHHDDLHAAADRVALREELAREGGADDDDVGLLAQLAILEEATLEQRDAHRPEVPVVADPDLRRRLLPGAGGRLALDREIRRRAHARERQEVDGARRRDARDRARPLDRVAEEGEDLRVDLLVGALQAVHRDAGGEQSLRVEPGVDARDAGQAAQQQAGADEQDGGERDLGDDQALAQAACPRSPARRSQPLLERVRERAARSLEGGREAADHRRRDRDEDRERDDRRAQVHSRERRRVGRRDRDEETDGRAREPEARHAPEQREEQALRQQLPDDARASGAERRSDRHLLPPPHAARQEQVRHVDAGRSAGRRRPRPRGRAAPARSRRRPPAAWEKGARSSPCRSAGARP
jgi:hypothetical protein